MKVKFAKTRMVSFLSLPSDIIKNVIDWRDRLKSKGFRDSDPLFPVVDNRFGQGNLLTATIRKDEIKSDTTMRDIFKTAFQKAGFDYIHPHSFRRTIARYAQTQSPEFINAIRQNLGHSSIDTTLNSYERLSMLDQRKIIMGVKLLNVN
jgi:integrase/recombinase XerD